MFFAILVATCTAASAQTIRISANKRFFSDQSGRPFFWLGDTAWLLFVRCSREDTIRYLETRRRQGFNVVQVMLIHDLRKTANSYNDEAVEGTDVSRPKTTPGKRFSSAAEYDYWDHVEWAIDEAAKRGITMALVPVWGSNVKGGLVSESQAKAYAEFLAARFKSKKNVVWLNGGDLRGDDKPEIWQMFGRTLKANDPNHLITFHPRGRTMSSEFFHSEEWLDFNMFQSGHRNYAQDNSPTEKHHFGEDNWRYLQIDYDLKPTKPTLDGEPSYENIPQGLHDPQEPRWKAADIRRYAYWSVFAGGSGFTYGENSVMQFHVKGRPDPAYGAELEWTDSINAEGASQMKHLKNLMLSQPYFERIPADFIVADQGQRYSRVAVTAGRDYVLAYVYTGRKFRLNLTSIGSSRMHARWFDPRTGTKSARFPVPIGKEVSFDPPGDEADGNDWVLILEKI